MISDNGQLMYRCIYVIFGGEYSSMTLFPFPLPTPPTTPPTTPTSTHHSPLHPPLHGRASISLQHLRIDQCHLVPLVGNTCYQGRWFRERGGLELKGSEPQIYVLPVISSQLSPIPLVYLRCECTKDNSCRWYIPGYRFYQMNVTHKSINTEDKIKGIGVQWKHQMLICFFRKFKG